MRLSVKGSASSLTLFALCLLPFVVQAQKFWLTTNEFPGGPKTGITLADDSCLFVGLRAGVIRSCNEGQTFDSTLSASVVFTVFATASGKVLAGGAGEVFYTSDLGQSWDSVSLGSSYPVTQFIENSSGDLFAITGVLDVNLGYLGDGIFFSDDGGVSWTPRNNGLGIYKSCERIAIDKNDRLYLAVADEFVTGNGGLFVSDNSGMLWDHVSITIDGKGTIPDQIKVGNTFGLSVSPDDSLHFSFSGTAVNAGVMLNTSKSIYDIKANSFWNVYQVFNSVSWWLDRNLNNIHFARNGDWYSSTNGSVNIGGTYFSRDKGRSWDKIDYGLGLDDFGKRNVQYFAETAAGKVFMVQLLDERVYWADTSVLTSLRPVPTSATDVSVYPNPVHREDRVFVKVTGQAIEHCVTLYDLTGRELTSQVEKSGIAKVQAPKVAGVYLLVVESRFSKVMARIVVL